MDLLAFGVAAFVVLPVVVGLLVRTPASYLLWLALVTFAVASQAAVDAVFVVPVLLTAGASFLFVWIGVRLRRRGSPR